MSDFLIPLSPLPSQYFNVKLGKQDCRLSVYQKRGRIYLDLWRDGQALITGALARDRLFILRASYKGFLGDLYFADLQGNDDPEYSGLGSRWVLIYRA